MKEGNDAGNDWEAKARMTKNDKEEAGGRECGESRVENRGSRRLNEMEGRCESNCGRDEVYPSTFGDEERTGLKLDDDDDDWDK